MAKYNPGQRWYDLSDMGIEDVLLMRIFDSTLCGGLDEGRVGVHASFEDTGAKYEARESIEFRCKSAFRIRGLSVISKFRG